MLGKLVWSGHMHTVTHTHSNLPVNTKRSTVWKADLEWVVGAKPCWDRDKYNLRRNRSYLLKTSLSPEIKKNLGGMAVLEIHHFGGKKRGFWRCSSGGWWWM